MFASRRTAIQSLPRSAYPQGAVCVLNGREDVACEPFAGDGEMRDGTALPFDPDEGARRTYPHNSLAILIDPIDQSLTQVGGIPGIEGQNLERRGVRRKESGCGRAEGNPNVLLPILQQRGDAVFGEALIVRRVVAIADETFVHAIILQ